MSIDLSTYVRVGRYDLPEPTRSTAPANNLLAQEASGVAYNWDTGTLFIVGDGGQSVTEVSLTGQFISTMTLALGNSPQGTEFFDPEGIVYVGGGQFVMTEERDRNAVKFTYEAGTTLDRAETQTVDLGTFSPNLGLEGLTYDPLTGGFIFVKEKQPMGVFQTTIDFAAGTASNGSSTTENSVNLFDPNLLGVTDIADVFAFSNIASLVGTPEEGNLLILSQESGKILEVDRLGNVLSSLTLQTDPGNPLNIAAQGHEGISMGPDGTIYVVSENGGGDADHPQLWVFKPSNGINAAPTEVTLTNATTAFLENTSTATRLKVADVQVTDDGLGTNTLSVSGADASFFEVDNTGLYVKAGTTLDYETKTSYNVTVNVDDTTLGATPDASTSFTLDVTDVVIEGALPTVYISEVAPWSSGNSPIAADWFEVTNGGTTTLNITGWKVDDNSNSFAAALSLNGITSIAPGESVIFMESSTPATAVAAFKNIWFGGNAPAGLQIGTYTGSGIGLSTGGDAVNLYNASGVLQANVVFGASPTGPYATFDNSAGLNNTTISTLSANNTKGAFKAANDQAEIGSPGVVAEIAPVITSNGGGSTTLIQINENTTAVTTVTATDKNFGDTVSYAITGGADAAKFAVDAATGALSFIAAPNFEAPTDAGQNNFYDVVVTASDGSLTDAQAIQVKVNNVSDTAPFITSNGAGATASVTVAENIAAVTTVTASDDLGDTLTYSVSGGADAAKFAINSATGALSFVNAPNFERPTDAGGNNIYDVEVAVSDGTYSDTQAISVSVGDVADTASSQTPYLVSAAGNVTVQAILTTGDTVSKVGGGSYRMAGIPDGLGMFDNGDGTVTVLMNQEIGTSGGAPLGVVRAHGAAGAFVTQLVIDKATLSVISGDDAIKTVKLFDDATGTYVTASSYAINRLCSADLAAASAYYWVDPETSVAYGTESRIFMTGEEAGTEGKQFAVFVTGAEAGTAYEFADAGLFSWENNLASPFAQKKTITIGQDDGQNGQVYVYVGEKQASGTEFQKAGLEGGHLFGIKVTNLVNAIAANSNETDGVAASGRFTLSDQGEVGALTGTQLDAQSEAAGVTSFQRPEDGSWDPTNPNVYWFVTTASITGQSRLYKMTFDDITQPELGGSIEAVLDSNQLPVNDTIGVRMMDNMTVNAEGKIIIQEDVGNNAFIGRVLQYDPVTDKLTVIAKHDASRFVTGGSNFLTQDEESSGVIDVTSAFGDATHKAYLVDTQSHKAVGGELVEGGQLQLIKVALNAPVIAGGDSAAITVTENGTAVTTVSAADDVMDTVTYSITGGADAALFSIDAATGALSFVAAPNFEAATDADVNNVYDVNVTASDGSLVDTQSISVTVSDVLDTGAFTGTARSDTFTAPNDFDYTIRGLAGNDLLTGNNGDDVIDGGLGNDVISGAAGNDNLEGGVGNDIIDGGEGIDVLSGSAGNDQLSGGNGADVLNGGGGLDVLNGGIGADVLTGGAQRDTLIGGDGTDQFVLDDKQLLDDVITDFTIGEDKIVLDTSAFAAFSGSEAVSANQFALGTKATSAEQRLIYDQASGRLYYDADGNGGAAKKFVASISNHAAIGAGDFVVQGGAAPSIAASQFVQAIAQFGTGSSGGLDADNDFSAPFQNQPTLLAAAGQ
ncbi:SdiA-regulated domain-containing protein [Novosphingobium sp. MMS21-SN21R]|uniref:SdiA-regulated domain-containing protein n=1 Tax=Novosphingobium sp. MMS21-SN21R TaxID=2969298 RepID=UPI0028881EE3|nr:SdiA-regulated domain-containing protein [Novosphingobium sp. MMS21-SN21R]MDT0507339.1 SdiA-regulated domain-containing protein [Novosphingobium sp. MMS21-SN21R]